MTTLQILSLSGLIIYFSILLLAVTKEKKSENIIDYFFAGRSLPFWALSITFIASWWGAGSAISSADLAYKDGLNAFWYYGVPVLIATFLMFIGAKAIRRVGYLTQGEMMTARYSKSIAKMLSLMILIFMTLTAASQMVGIGQFFGTYLGLKYEVSVLLGTSIVLVYSVFGGFRGVVLTDIIQFVLLLGSAVTIFIIAFTHSGGFANISAISAAAGKPDYMSMGAGVSKYLTYVITFGCAWTIQANVWQRISATKSDSDAKKMTLMSFFSYIPLYLIVVFTGMASITLFDELPEGGVVSAIVITYTHPVVGSFIFVGISAAIMSTMDSLINTGAMTLSIDLRRKNVSEEEKLKFSRLATILVTGAALLVALGIRSILEIAWLASDVITTGVFVPLIAGFVWRRGNSKGAMAAMITGLFYSAYNLLISLGVTLPTFWEPQSAVQALLGICLSAWVYIGISLLTAPEYEKADSFIRRAKGKE